MHRKTEGDASVKTQAIFISYARADSEFAIKLANALRAANVHIWIDQLDIPAGNRWDIAIEKALKDADSLIVILSKSSVSSNNVMDEVSYALEVGKNIFPILAEECDVPFRLRRLQFIDFKADYEKGLARLLAALNAEPASVAKSFDSETQKTPSVPLVDRDKNRPILGKIRKNRSLKWVSAGTFLGIIALTIAYIYSPFNVAASRQSLQKVLEGRYQVHLGPDGGCEGGAANSFPSKLASIKIENGSSLFATNECGDGSPVNIIDSTHGSWWDQAITFHISDGSVMITEDRPHGNSWTKVQR